MIDDSEESCREMEHDRPVLVPTGEYRVVLSHWKKFWHFSRLDLVMGFEIVEENDYCGVLLPNYYQVKWNGEQIVAGWKSHFCRDYQQCFGAVERTDQFEIKEFENLVFLAEVREVTHDQEKRLLAKVNQYSRIGRLLGAISSMEVSE
mgnify:CR=1 FL=1